METNSDKLFSEEASANQEQSSPITNEIIETTMPENEHPISENEVNSNEILSTAEPVIIADTNETENLIVDSNQPTPENESSTIITENPVEVIPVHEVESEEAVMALEEKYAAMSKEELANELNEVISEENMDAIKRRVSLIKIAYTRLKSADTKLQLEKFIEEGGDKINFVITDDSIDYNFNVIFGKYKQLKKEKDAQIEQERIDNLQKKIEVLEDIKKLINSEETIKKTYDEFKILQDKWASIGQVPPKELNNLLQSYHHHVEMFFDFIKLNKEMKDLDMRKNLELKIDLCEKAEELLIESSINTSFNKLQEYHLLWKEIGPVPSDKKDDIWERFKAVSDKLNEQRKEYYDKQQAEREQNLELKTVLCEKVEQIAELECETAKEWDDRANEIMAAQKEWKAIGFAPKKSNEAVWRRFKDANDLFFEKRTEYYKSLKNDRIDNLNKKTELCIKAETLQNSTDWKQSTAEYLKMQEEWKTVGPVPQKHSDKVWKRFRTACDAFFNSKSQHFSSMGDEQVVNMNLKKELIEKIEAFVFNDNSSDNLNILKDFQRQWMEIGHVPLKEKDKLYKQFKGAIDKHFENLKLSSSEKQNLRYKARIDNLKDDPNGNYQISQEKRFMQNKISTLQSDIAIWENNIGFLSKSKSSESFKQQYIQKIEKAKEQIDEMKKKLQLLRNS